MSTLSRRRGTIKSQLTRFKTFIDGIDANNVSAHTRAQIESRIEKMNLLWNDFEEVQTEIDNQSEDVDLETSERDDFETKFFALIARMKTLVIPKATTLPSTASPTSVATRTINIPLPEISLPSFDGTLTKWREFKDSFDALITNNHNISVIQRFYYLKSALKGNAAAVLENIKVSEPNYSTAWELLTARFENKQLIIDHHIKAIMDLPSVNKESLTALRTLHDTATQHVRSLYAICEDSKHWDVLLIYIFSTKLDPSSRRDWEKTRQTKQNPKFDDFQEFILKKCALLESIKTDNANAARYEVKLSPKIKPVKLTVATANAKAPRFTCPYCKDSHPLYQCAKFKGLSVNARIEEARRLQLCINCLREGHELNDCRFTACRTCNRRHNTLLHLDTNTNAAPEVKPTTDAVIVTHSLANKLSHVILSTALINVEDDIGNLHRCRAILDSGSQSTLISSSLTERLHLPVTRISVSLVGVNKSVSTVNSSVNITISSTHSSFSVQNTCLVVPHVTDDLPRIPIDRNKLNIPSDLTLADPNFCDGGQIDVLLGADLFWNLIGPGHIPGDKQTPALHESVFGWLISGRLPSAITPTRFTQNCIQTSNNELNDCLARFWNMEDVLPQDTRSEDEKYCEEHFVKTHRREPSGRFVVEIPFKNNLYKLGNSYNNALSRLHSLERRFKRDPCLKQEYVSFMREYEALDHMKGISLDTSGQIDGYFIPHHAVFKGEGDNRKIRVVFDASAKTSSGLSLNEVQYTGPPLQNDIFEILTRFRSHPFVFSADIVKMFRQVKVTPDHRKYQRILWRENTNQAVKAYELKTVSYGQASAPFLAMRALRQLAFDEDIDPSLSNLLKNNFYVDDVLAGAQCIQDVLDIKTNLTNLLSSAGFELCKWRTNFGLPSENLSHEKPIDIGDTKILGVSWQSDDDLIKYSFNFEDTRLPITKRGVLSVIARLYDPLGILAPVIINGKKLMQELWQLKISWDDPLPQETSSRWIKYQQQLNDINNIKIPRHVLSVEYNAVELHGFCDASQSAYGACIFIRTINENDTFDTRLLCARSKVSPLQTVSLPRLELCAAHILAKLYNRVITSIEISFNRVYLWTDSTITLSWIRGCPSRWKTFVANRVSHIQQLTDVNNWFHVNTKDNPADIISRGSNASELINNRLWFYGPHWLSFPVDNWPSIDLDLPADEREHDEEIRLISNITSAQDKFDLWNRYSSLIRLQRVFAYCLRFVKRTRLPAVKIQTKGDAELTVEELRISLEKLIKLAQRETFSEEIKQLSQGRNTRNKNNLISLNPFIDSGGLLRVGGRLKNSSFDYDKVHPIILPAKHALTTLIVTREHFRLKHAGPQLLLASLRQQYWPISGRDLCRSVVRNCVTCFRAAPQNAPPVMGNLPPSRVTISAPFLNVGVDYAGPFAIKDKKTRGCRLIKAYVCLFVCMATKAVHLELVGDLSTEGFLAALNRFISRRGRPSTIHSDNGTNFVGAHTEIKNIIESLRQDDAHITNAMSHEGIVWKFNPPRAPNFGGLWEAAVRSMKTHLNRVAGNNKFTYEEFSTILVQIEGVLNSRPLCPLSNDPSDLNPLTPAHFLIGRPIATLPERNYVDVNVHRLSRFQMIQQSIQHFWKRWSTEYLSQLQSRSKWKRSTNNVYQVGRLVLIQDDTTPPFCWPLGRITDVMPGSDGIVRVAAIKARGKTIKRPVTKLFVFPKEDDDLEDTEMLQPGEHVHALLSARITKPETPARLGCARTTTRDRRKGIV